MKVTAQPEKCVAAGLCVAAQSAVFDQDEETGTVVILDAEPPAELRDSVREAIVLCPAQAIALSGDGDSE